MVCHMMEAAVWSVVFLKLPPPYEVTQTGVRITGPIHTLFPVPGVIFLCSILQNLDYLLQTIPWEECPTELTEVVLYPSVGQRVSWAEDFFRREGFE